TGLQHLAYAWDKVGNLTQRQDSRQSLTETFQYDPLDRLDSSKLNSVVNLDLAYDAIGNLTSKSDVGAYSYHPTKKHAVTSAGSNTYTYDANGNAITRNGFSITWTSYNLPSLINGAGGNSSAFSYGPERQRWKQQASYSGTPETTLYLGGLLEKVTLGSGTSWRHHILGGDGDVAIYTRKSSGSNEVHYLSKDHLGSTDVITDAAGAVEVSTSFGAFGQRRNAAGWSGNPAPADWTGITTTTRHGYTGHAMLDNLNLTHMNGRVYDQITARFLSPDPLVQSPFDGQSLNRYSYVFNNPLSNTDPSGFYTLFSTHQNADGSGGFGGFGDFLFATRSVHYGRPYYDFTDYSGRSRSGVLNAPPPNQAANQVASQAGPNATTAGVCNTERCSSVGGLTDGPPDGLVVSGYGNLQFADYLDLLALGYYQRQASTVLPGGFLLPVGRVRFNSGSDLSATQGR
ncbi:MAG: RHS repeat-associated core domain-containing protein, partial [Gammaproteobacteria bacterium]